MGVGGRHNAIHNRLDAGNHLGGKEDMLTLGLGAGNEDEGILSRSVCHNQ